MKQICLLGATGSIGQNCVDIVERFPEKFAIKYLSAHANANLLLQTARRCDCRLVAFSGGELALEARQEFARAGIEVLCGKESLQELASLSDYDILVNAVVGAAGLQPTLAAIRPGRTIALANKETLVSGGELVMAKARANGVTVIPIDSEHSALWQCLVGETRGEIRRLILTASGGPFRNLAASAFAEVTLEQALAHPNWNMGQKITIDSATLMNKGLEVIEASWLFGMPAAQIAVVIHPQSIVHSMVEFVDGSIKAQLGLPDMRFPIQYALSYPERLENTLPRMNFDLFHTLNFFEPDRQKFRALDLAFAALEAAGTAPAVLNAANEEAVYAFLGGKIRFDRIPWLVESALEAHDNESEIDLEKVNHADSWARAFVNARLNGAPVT